MTRPHFPPGYLEHPTSLLTWEQVEGWLVEARQYWVCSVRPDGRPHAVPVWGVWVSAHAYFDGSPETRHARNLALNPNVSLHVETGDRVVILEGTAGELRPSAELGIELARAYALKYAALGYAPAPNSWDAGGLMQVEPHSILAWSSFTLDPTKFIFPPRRDP